jgi:hypothetical protein
MLQRKLLKSDLPDLSDDSFLSLVKLFYRGEQMPVEELSFEQFDERFMAAYRFEEKNEETLLPVVLLKGKDNE